MAARVPLDRLLVETDCPYLAPVPHRGQRNEPAFVRDTAACLADVVGIELDALVEQSVGQQHARVSGVRARTAGGRVSPVAGVSPHPDAIRAILALVQPGLARTEASLGALADSDDAVLGPMLSTVLPGHRQTAAAGAGAADRPAGAARVDPDALNHMAVGVELLHTASLVHDDIVDESDTRHGGATLYARVGNALAVLVGDYLFSQAAQECVATGNLEVVRLFAETLGRDGPGPDQRRQRPAWRPPRLGDAEPRALLTARSPARRRRCSCWRARAPGCWSSMSQAQVDGLRAYGQSLGLAFQVVDDILDFTGTEQELGKPVGSDLRQGTITLPVILMRDGQLADGACAARSSQTTSTCRCGWFRKAARSRPPTPKPKRWSAPSARERADELLPRGRRTRRLDALATTSPAATLSATRAASLREQWRLAAAEHAPQAAEPALAVRAAVRDALAAPHPATAAAGHARAAAVASANQRADQRRASATARPSISTQRCSDAAQRHAADDGQRQQPADQQQRQAPAAERFWRWQPQVEAAERVAEPTRRAPHSIAERLVLQPTFRQPNDVVDLALETVGRRRRRHADSGATGLNYTRSRVRHGVACSSCRKSPWTQPFRL